MIMDRPMLATAGDITQLPSDQWAYEGLWHGYRAMVHIGRTGTRLYSISGREITDEFPSLQTLGSCSDEYTVILDGEIVAPDPIGVTSFAALEAGIRGAVPVEFWAYDILQMDSASLMHATYSDRRKALEYISVLMDITVPLQFAGDGHAAINAAAQLGCEGIVAKRRNSTYQSGRSGAWIRHDYTLQRQG